MAISVAIKKRYKLSNGFGVVADVTMNDSYPTGGESVTPEQFGLSALAFVLPSSADGYFFEFDHTNGKLKAYVPVSVVAGGGTAAADANNALIKKATGGLQVTGTGTAFQAPADEVADKTDLSALMVRVLALGY